MSVAAPKKSISVALIGNPNTGKSTLFTALSGTRQRIGNYPGVTVEKKIGRVEFSGTHFTLIDLPGTYSLAPKSPDEMVSVDVLLGRTKDVPTPDVVLCIVDASNLERNLYLVSQALELGLPTVLAMNMTDIAAQRGLKLDLPRLQQQLGMAVVALQANKRKGIDELKQKLIAAANMPVGERSNPFPPAFKTEVAELAAKIKPAIPRYLVERLLLDTGDYLQHASIAGITPEVSGEIKAARSRLTAVGLPVPAVEAMSRYAWVGEVLTGVVARPSIKPVTASDKFDKVLTHKFFGTVIFLLVMLLMFQSIFAWAEPVMKLVEAGQEWLGEAVGSRMPEGALKSLVVDGIIAGLGSVIIFLPQILILFFFIAVLEDCGYMARAAYLMDKLMVRVGLSGKSFIPLLSSFACAIPGVMATRVIENRRDRLTTILIAPLMSCSARIPVYVLLTAAIIPSLTLFQLTFVETENYWFGLYIGLQGVIFFAMYMVGVAVAVIVALLLKKTLLKGPTPPFVMELPSYKLPSWKLVLFRMWESGWGFLKRAGTIIFAVTIIVWAAGYYPRNEAAIEGLFAEQKERLEKSLEELGEPVEVAEGLALSPEEEAKQAQREELQGQLDEIEHQIAGEHIRQSYLGQMGHAIEPVVEPLGWDWRIGSAAIASFPAREVIVATLGIIYNLGDEEDEESQPLREKLKSQTWDNDPERKVFTIPVALSVMVFFALCAQCGATLAVIRRETNSWRWPIFSFVYMTVLAYVAALVVYQVGTLIAGA